MRDLWQRLLQPAAEVGLEVRRDLLVQSAQASGFTSLMGLGLMAMVVFGLHERGVGPGLATWCAINLVYTVIFHLGMQWHARHEPRPASRVLVQQWTLAGFYAVAGISWGNLAFLALPHGVHVGARAVVCTALMIAMAGNIAFASATPIPFLAFHLALTLTAATGLALAGATYLAACIVFSLFAALPLQKELYLQISGAKLLARRAQLLADQLRDERAEVEQANLRLVEANVELSHRATRDPLTGLANRALFFEHLASTLARYRPLGRVLSVIYVDLDRFKLINDTLGHAAGDELLQQVGPRINDVLGESDVLARLGGDEFVVLAVGGGDGAEVVAERIRRGFEAPFRIAGRPVHVTPSLGVAHDDGHSSGPTLVANADVALYRAKELGRDRVQTFDGSLTSPLRERVRDEHPEGPLFGADAVVTAHFQRMLDVGTGGFAGVEVVVGLNEPDVEPLSGDALRDLAERTGVRARLDAELLRQGALFLTGLGSHREPGFRVLARLARPDVEFDDLARFLRGGEMGAVVTGLTVAFAEQQIVSDLAVASGRIQAIRDLGVRVVLDDAGQGVCSLSALATLPLDGVRLAPDLIHAAVDGSAAARASLAGVVEVARHRDIEVAATGVDTDDHLALLRDLGVHLVQGEIVPAVRTVSHPG